MKSFLGERVGNLAQFALVTASVGGLTGVDHNLGPILLSLIDDPADQVFQRLDRHASVAPQPLRTPPQGDFNLSVMGLDRHLHIQFEAAQKVAHHHRGSYAIIGTNVDFDLCVPTPEDSQESTGSGIDWIYDNLFTRGS